MVIVHNAAVAADRHIDAGFFIIFVTGFANIDQRRSLTAANPLGLTGNADRTAADTDFYKISAAFRQKTETFRIHYVAGPNLHRITVMIPDPFQREPLPLGITFGRVDTQHVHPGFHQSGHTLRIIAGIDTGAYHMAFFIVQQFQRVFFMRYIVFTEHHVQQTAFIINDGQRIEFMIPDNIISLLQGRILFPYDHLLDRGHKIFHLRRQIHTADTIVTAGNDTFQTSVYGSVAGHCHSRMTCLFFQRQNVFQGAVRSNVGITGHKAGPVTFYIAHHLGFVFNRLGAIDKGTAAFPGQCDCQRIVGNGLHNSRNHRDI